MQAVGPAERADRILCVVPAYNEAGNIAAVIQDVRTHVPGADVLVVDDGSADETAWEAGRSGAIVCRLPFNLGYGVALQTGYKHAARNGYAYVVQIDGDGQHKAEYIPQMLERLEAEDMDFVIGSRFLGEQGYRVPLLRRIGIAVFRTIASILTGRRISDPTSGYQAFNRKVLDILVTDAYPWDYPDADVIIMLHRAGVRIAEIPVKMRLAPDQQSMHSGLRPIYYVFKMLLSIFVTLLRAAPTRAGGG